AEEAEQKPAHWAAGHLCDALKGRGVAAEVYENLEQAPASFDCVLAATAVSMSGRQALDASRVSLPNVPEAVGLARGRVATQAPARRGGREHRRCGIFVETESQKEFPPRQGRHRNMSPL